MRNVTGERRGTLLSFATVWSLLAIALPAQAASTATDPIAALRTVVVTAQRRRQNPQNVPISMQVVTASELADRNTNSLASLSQTMPGVYVNSNGRGSDMFIRGIGSGLNQSFDQAVSTFVDDVYEGRSRMSDATFLDLQRIEVLKGPQSTFFGNNAIAGAIRLVTAKPGDRFEGSARALYGQFGQYAVEAAAGGPLTDTLGLRVAAMTEGDRGFLYNTNLHRHVPANQGDAGRVTLDFRPGRSLDVTLMVQAGRKRDTGDEGTFEQLIGCPPSAPFAPAGFCKTVIADGLPNGTNNNLTAYPSGAGYSLDSHLFVLTANYHRWDQTFTSVTGFTGYHFNVNEAGNETQNNGPALFTVHAPERYHQFSQEFRLTSPKNRAIEYMAGVYFQTDQLNYTEDFNFAFLNPLLSAPPFSAMALPLGQQVNDRQNEQNYAIFGSATWNVTEHLKLSGGLRGAWVSKNFNSALFYGNAMGAYGGILPYAGTLCTAPGATTNPPTSLQALASVLQLGSPCAFAGQRTDHAWLPSVQLQYRLMPGAMVYFSYAKGFLAGGFNGADNTGVRSNIPYGPEHVQDYEVGLKSEWLHHTLLLNLDAFHSVYTNLQVSSFIVNPAPVSLVNNAASAISQGLELQGEWVAGEHLQLSANVTYLDAYYGRYPNAGLTTLQTYCGSAKDVPVPSANPGCVAAFGHTGKLPTPYQDLSGKPTAFAPKWSGNLTARYTVPFVQGWRLIGSVTPYFTTGYFLSGNGTNDPLEYQGGYIRLDARLTVKSPNDHLAVDVIGDNLTDKTILTQISGLPASIGSFAASKEMPRNFAFQVRYRW